MRCTVNHTENFVGPDTAEPKLKQTIETLRLRVKIKYGIKSGGATTILERQSKDYQSY